MKKPKTYNLKREIYETINKLAQADGRSDSDWLNIHLGNTLPTKEVSKPKTAVVKSEPIYPENLNTGAWAMWLDFRKKAKFKSYKTDSAAKKLSKMGSFDEQTLIVQQSIDNEYQGLFALKGNSNERFNGNNTRSSQKESSHERIKRENQIKYGQPDECGLVVGEDDRNLGREVGEGQRTEAISGLDNQPFIDYDQSS